MKVSIIGAEGGIGSEITKSFLMKDPSQIDELSLITKEKEGCKKLYSFAQDSYTRIPKIEISPSTNLHCLEKSDIIVFCAGLGVSSTNVRREQLFNENSKLLHDYCEKINKLTRESIILVVTSPVSQIMQHNVKDSKNTLIGIGVVNDTVRLRKAFERKFGYNEENLFVIGDHLTNQTITSSQLPKDISSQLRKEEEKYVEENKVSNMFEYIREQNYRLLDEEDTEKMFEFVESLPLRYQPVARQRFCHFLAKTGLSTCNAIQVLFENIVTGEGKISAQVLTHNYMGLKDSILGIPLKFEDMKPYPIELNYSEEEMNILQKCSELYSVE